MQTIIICSSANFYKHAIEIQAALESIGYTVVVPKTATRMKETGDYEVSHYKTWFGDANDYHKKADYMRAHFDRISEGDAILVLNDEKNGVLNYIGPNVLMEMSLAWYLEKPIFVLNDLPENSPFEEELRGFMPTILHGDLTQIV